MDFLSLLHEMIATLDTLDTQPQLQALMISSVFSVVVIVASIILTIFVKSRALRMVILPFLFILTLMFSHQYSGSVSNYLVNVSTEFLGAIIALLILSEWMADERWALALVAAVVLVLPFVFQLSGYFTESFILNLRADLLGGLVVFTLLHRRWLIVSHIEEKVQKDEGKLKLERKLNAIALHNLHTKRLRPFVWKHSDWDFDIVIRGANKQDVTDKLNQLKHVTRILHMDDPVYDEVHDCSYQFLVCSLRMETAAAKNAVRLRVKGPEALLGPVLETIHEVFDIEREQYTDDNGAAFVITPSSASFSQMVAWAFQDLLDQRIAQRAYGQGGGNSSVQKCNDDFEAGYTLAIKEMIDRIQPAGSSAPPASSI